MTLLVELPDVDTLEALNTTIQVVTAALSNAGLQPTKVVPWASDLTRTSSGLPNLPTLPGLPTISG